MPLDSLIVHGPFRGPSGYDHHVREFTRELHRQGVTVGLADMPAWSPTKLPEHLRDPWFESLAEPPDARIVLHFCMPHQVIPREGKLDVNYTMFEATRIAREWVQHNRRHDLVIVPTASSEEAWVRSGVPAERVRVCPLGINAAAFTGPFDPLHIRLANGEPVDQYRTRFLNVSALDARKNLLALLKAWILATEASDDAVLVLKIGVYWGDHWLKIFHWNVSRVEALVGKTLAQAAPVYFMYETLSDVDMPRLYASATHYVSMSHGEGWDQPMVEAASSGLRLIAPDHSAYRAYLDPTVATMVPSREVRADYIGAPVTARLFEGANWWQPDEQATIAAIRAAIDGSDAPRASARARLLRDFTWERATQRLITILAELEARKAQRWFSRLPRLSRSARTA